MADDRNPLEDLTPAELHDEGLHYLDQARREFAKAPNAAACASVSIACFFASMSAENLGSLVGAHRDNTPPHGVPPVRPNEFTSHHG